MVAAGFPPQWGAGATACVDFVQTKVFSYNNWDINVEFIITVLHLS